MDQSVFSENLFNDSKRRIDDFYSKYSLGERLGDGMSSIVYKCSNLSNNNEKLAVKIVDLLKGDLSEEALRAEVKREIEILEMMDNHPFIINIVTSLETIANIFIVTDLCEEGDLYDFMAERITLTAACTVKIMRQLGDAVAYIHSHCVVHRDIKLENILLSNRNTHSIKLADFGLAVKAVHDTEITEIVGTPAYYAPELILTAKGQADGYGRPVDIWACGVVMYNLLIGRGPFQNRRQHLMFRAITNGNFDKTDFLWQSLASELKELIEDMLVVDPKARLKAEKFQKRISSNCMSGNFSFPMGDKSSRGYPSLKVVAIAVRACIRLYHLTLVIKGDIARDDPFSCRLGRELITSMVLEIYGHWVKRDQFNQVLAIHADYYIDIFESDSIHSVHENDDDDDNVTLSLANPGSESEKG